MSTNAASDGEIKSSRKLNVMSSAGYVNSENACHPEKWTLTLVPRQRKWPEEKIPVDLEPVPGFNLRAQIVGSGGSYVKHIQSETGCRVQIKGLGSGYLEVATNRESEEDMFLHVT